MSRKVFASFLGTSNYLATNYFLGDQKVDGVRYIQEALVRMFCADWEESDLVLIFCTDEAAKQNWEDKEHSKAESADQEGLQSRLQALKMQGLLKAEVRMCLIPEGFTEDEIWDVFAVVYEQLHENDRVWLDITHAFRSIPLFMLVLLNYSQFLKQVQLEAIYYGAFEKLGPAYKVREMPLVERNAPVLDLHSFVALMDWTKAASDFVDFGNSKRLGVLAQKSVSGVLRETRGKDSSAAATRRLADALPSFTDKMLTNRGKDIFHGKELGVILEALDQVEEVVSTPFRPLFANIKKEMEVFREQSNVMNGFAAAYWCWKNNYLQQCITLLYENSITWVCLRFDLDWEMKSKREFISSALKCLSEKKDPLQFFKTEEALRDYEKLLTDEVFSNVGMAFERLRDLRNDINHAGVRFNAVKPSTLRSAMESVMLRVFAIVGYNTESNN